MCVMFDYIRVLGILAVTRSFGDHGMKDFVTASPHLSEVDLSGSSQPYPFLILACDGVWDVLSDEEAVDLIMDTYVSQGGPFEEAAEMLVRTMPFSTEVKAYVSLSMIVYVHIVCTYRIFYVIVL